MCDLNPAILLKLRRMANNGDKPSQMLRTVVGRLAPQLVHKMTLIKYMREAFCLSLQQASPIAGWMADGSGELGDAQLNAFVMPEIANNRPVWSALAMASSA